MEEGMCQDCEGIRTLLGLALKPVKPVKVICDKCPECPMYGVLHEIDGRTYVSFGAPCPKGYWGLNCGFELLNEEG